MAHSVVYIYTQVSTYVAHASRPNFSAANGDMNRFQGSSLHSRHGNASDRLNFCASRYGLQHSKPGRSLVLASASDSESPQVEKDTKRIKRRTRHPLPFTRVKNPTGATSISPVQPMDQISELRTMPMPLPVPDVTDVMDKTKTLSASELRRMGLSQFANGPPSIEETMPEEGQDARTKDVLQTFNDSSRWNKHRNSARYWRHLRSVFSSTTFYNLRMPLAFLALDSTVLTGYEYLVVRPCVCMQRHMYGVPPRG